MSRVWRASSVRVGVRVVQVTCKSLILKDCASRRASLVQVFKLARKMLILLHKFGASRVCASVQVAPIRGTHLHRGLNGAPERAQAPIVLRIKVTYTGQGQNLRGPPLFENLSKCF